MSRHIKILLCIFLCTGLLQARIAWAQVGEDSSKPALAGPDGVAISLKAQSMPLGELLEEIRKRHGIEVVGLEGRSHEAVTFSFMGDVQEEIVRFLAHIGERNYAFLFTNERLSRVQVVPLGGEDLSAAPPEPEEEAAVVSQSRTLGVRVQEIVEGSQAERADILMGDIIAKYDGTPISSSRDLIALVKQKPGFQGVEVVLLREGQPVRIFLDGGFIGVKITDSQIQSEEMEGYRLWGSQ